MGNSFHSTSLHKSYMNQIRRDMHVQPDSKLILVKNFTYLIDAVFKNFFNTL